MRWQKAEAFNGSLAVCSGDHDVRYGRDAPGGIFDRRYGAPAVGESISAEYAQDVVRSFAEKFVCAQLLLWVSFSSV